MVGPRRKHTSQSAERREGGLLSSALPKCNHRVGQFDFKFLCPDPSAME